MKSRTNRKIIVGLLLFVVAMSVGYAVFGQQLNITGSGSLDYDWDIHFATLFSEGGMTGQTAPAITDDSVSFNVVFTEPGQTKSYEFRVLNQGTIDAILKSTELTAAPTNVAGITFTYTVGIETDKDSIIPETSATVSSVGANTLANTLGVHYVTVTMSYDSTTPTTGATDATFTLKLNYEQQ